MDTKEFEHRKELCQIIRDANAELDNLNAAARLANAPKVIYADLDMSRPTYSRVRYCDHDVEYVRADLAAKLREMVDYLSGVCADQLADSPFPDEIDGLLDETKWLVLDEGGGSCLEA